MADIQYFVDGIQINETDTVQYFVDGVQVNETVAAVVADWPLQFYSKRIQDGLIQR